MKLMLVANWKNHPEDREEAKILISGLAKKSLLFKKLNTVIAPPAVYLDLVGQKVKSLGVLASQDIFEHEGTYTGAVGPNMQKDFGVKMAIIGHSERRKLGESNLVVANKVKTALKMGILPLLCVGEEAHDTDGAYFESLREQIKESLQGIKKKDLLGKLVVAYEPVWAIGKSAKEAMRPEDLAQMVIFIKKVLTELFDRNLADKAVILYGGSVDQSNIIDLKDTGVSGFLVGRASLNVKSFTELAQALTK